MTVACVLRSGGDFDASWVHALKAGVEEHLSIPHRFVCLTDMAIWGVEAVPINDWEAEASEYGVDGSALPCNWPGWWAKMNLFWHAPDGDMGFDDLVLYLDLDTLPVGPLDDFASYSGEFAMINDFYRGRRAAQSGVMLFRPGTVTKQIWEQWIADPEGHMKRFRGDGEWLDRHTSPDRLQDLYPGQIVSLKAHAKAGIPENARLVCGHGRPRFTDPKAGWAHALWSERAA